jgi:hypothetical protein
MKSESWLDLSAVEKAAYVQLASRFNGANNGRLVLSARILGAELRVSKDTAAKALNALAVAGLIECAKWSGFNSNAERLSREYRLTCYRCDVTGALPRKIPVRPQGQASQTTGTETNKILQN